jgi:hypothetical protein
MAASKFCYGDRVAGQIVDRWPVLLSRPAETQKTATQCGGRTKMTNPKIVLPKIAHFRRAKPFCTSAALHTHNAHAGDDCGNYGGNRSTYTDLYNILSVRDMNP